MNSTANKILLFYFIVLFLLAGTYNCKNIHEEEPVAVKHVIVYYEDDHFAGWPANNGIWSWGDEILVGFVQANHMDKEGHTYDQHTARHKYARSMDGGQTWNIEDAFEQGQTAWGHDHDLSEEQAELPVKLAESVPDFTNSDFVMAFVRHNNHDGPSHFYYSNNRGQQWEGPYNFPNLGTPGVATRTDYIVEDEQELSAFLTVAKSNELEGRVAYARTSDGGMSWQKISWIGTEPDGFNIMPSSVRLSDTDLITVIRSRDEDPRRDFLKAFRSKNNGESWQRLNDPVKHTGSGGSPPALIEMQDDRLALAYIYRSDKGSRVNIKFSSDEGASWSDEIMLRGGDGASRDVGYPRMVQRPDGKLVIVYYWNHALLENDTPYRYIAATIVDPEKIDSH